MDLGFRLIADLKCKVGESPVYDERTNRLFFVDIPARRLFMMALGDGVLKSFDFDKEVGSLGLAASGRLVVALRDEIILFDPDSEARQALCPVEADRPETRLNDGKVGPDGAFWVGSMDDRPEKQPLGHYTASTPQVGSIARSTASRFPTASPGRRTANGCSSRIHAGPGSTAGGSTAGPVP
jgi:sugar lactone lactonase YvrE